MPRNLKHVTDHSLLPASKLHSTRDQTQPEL